MDAALELISMERRMNDATDIELRLVDPAKNKFRLYGLTECRTLFGELCLRVAWGRIGHRRLQERSEVFDDESQLQRRRAELLARRRRHGYQLVSETRAPRRLTPRQDTALPTVMTTARTLIPPSPAPLPNTERHAVSVGGPALCRATAGERELVEAHGLRLRDGVAHALVEQWLCATRELSDYLAERTPERHDLTDVSMLAAMYANAAGMA
jgi:predicted DNA-binding WGR domain protein